MSSTVRAGDATDEGWRARMMRAPWAKVVGRAVFVLVAVAVLAAIGRIAGAQGPVDANADATATATPTPSAEADARASAQSAVTSPPAAVVPAASPPPSSPSSAARASPESPVALNLADETELRRLPGVGPKRAQAILALRTKLGRFHRLEELMRVKGVGRATLKKWRPLVTLEVSPRDHDGGPP